MSSGPNEPDWSAFRKRLRRRQTAGLFLILGPFVLLVTAARIFETHSYPSGDVRNEPIFWALVGLVAVVFVGAFMLSAIRTLREP